jgi:hypothetical protein
VPSLPFLAVTKTTNTAGVLAVFFLVEWLKAQDFRGARGSFADNFLQKQQKQRQPVAQLPILRIL